MKIKINANKVLEALTGDPIKERNCMHCGANNTGHGGLQEFYTVGRAIADTLVRPNPKATMNAMRALELAKKFYNEKEVEIESSDLKEIKEALEKETATSPLVRGQILIYLESAKTEKEIEMEKEAAPAETPAK